MTNWQRWISANWGALSGQRRVSAPDWLSHPSVEGFERPPVAEPAGQVEDWTMSMKDESRVHVHIYANGRRIVHRDRFDPSRSRLHAIMHIARETRFGSVVTVALAVGLVYVAVQAARA